MNENIGDWISLGLLHAKTRASESESERMMMESIKSYYIQK